MKRIGIVLLTCLLLCACEKKSKKQQEYEKWVAELREVSTNMDCPFQVSGKVEKLTDGEYTYYVTIDDFQKSISHIKALAIHNYPTQEVFPSIGIFDEEATLSTENKKGILLIGYLESEDLEDFTIKTKITYEKDSRKETCYKLFSFDN